MHFFIVAILCAARTIAFAADVSKGKELFRACSGCHNADTDARKAGPSLRTLFGKVTLRNGARTNEANVRALILDGLNRMPSYRYQFRDEEFDDLLAYLKTLNARLPLDDKAPPGKDLFVAYCGRCHGADSTNAKPAGSLQGLFKKEKLSDGRPVADRTVSVLIEEGHAEMSGTKNWLDAEAMKTLLAYLKSL